ncbi:MAG: FAD-dependent oxidoreductase, partial [Methylibium sp.]|nr:FAD-dependent oxidoreductase [Methylibium sp.]
HGSFHRDDGPHARAHRAAALMTQRVAGAWITEGRIEGELAGCLRLESRLDAASARAALAGQRLDSGYVDWLDRDAASRLCGLDLSSGAWHYPGGGWLAPRAYARQLLARSGAAFIGNAEVARIARRRDVWQALDARGDVLAEAPVLVLANALDAKRLLGGIEDAVSGLGGTDRPLSGAAARAVADRRHLHLYDGAKGVLTGTSAQAFAALSTVRGQISSLDIAHMPTLPLPRLPVAGSGYVLPPIDGRLVFGATSQAGDGHTHLRESDHRSNLVQLAGLCTGDANAWKALPWEGRVGWRTVTPDRLPLIGAAVDFEALRDAARADQPRFVPRLRDAEGGLYVFTGLGSRGIAWAALGAQLLASWVSGAPCPLEADLRHAIDPARLALQLRALR